MSNYSLNALKTATGAASASLAACKGDTVGPISMASFTCTSVDSISGYTYVVENTSEDYELLFSGEAANFDRIKLTPANFTWEVTSGTYISIGASPNYIATITASDMNPQTPSAQTTLQTVESNTLCCTFADGYNSTTTGGSPVTNYNTQLCKTVYSVDSYDGNATGLCLLADSPIIMSDGEVLEAGDLVEGDKLMGYQIIGIPPDDGFDYLNWNTENLEIVPKEVTLVNITYSFAKRYYSVNKGQVKGTYEHPMLVFDTELGYYTFKQLFNIKIGDFLIKGFNTKNYEEIEVTDIEIIDETLEIVSLDVEQQDTYLVNGYITHNKGGNTHTDLTAPAQVTGLSYYTPNLTWNAVSGADSYEVQVDDTSSSFSSLVLNINVGAVTSWDVSALGSGYYWVRVRAVDHGLTGSWSSTLSFTITTSLLSGLVSVWELDETTGTNVVDCFASNDGTNNGATINQSGTVANLNKCYSFDGVNDYVLINNNVISNTTAFSVSCWFMNKGNSGTYRCAVYRGSTNTVGSSDFWIGVEAGGNYIVGTIGANSGVGWAAGQTTIVAAIDTWYFVTVTWDGSNVNTYVNGNLEVTYALSSITFNTTPTRFGAADNGTTYQFNGLIDQVSIWNRDVDGGEINQVYNSGDGYVFCTLPTPTPTITPTVEASLNATGGSISYANIGGTDYKIHTFTSSGTFTVTTLGAGTVDVLVVAGGGGGGGRHGGGGGGGGVVYDNARSVTTTSYTVTIGAGGPHLPVADSNVQHSGGPGGDSSFGTLVANGGGGGGSYTDAGSKNGGCGGGGGASSYTAAGIANQGASTGDVGYGENGGVGGSYGGGGGGAGQAGYSYSVGQDGGDGVQLNWTGTATYYAGGGGGGHPTNGSTNPGGAGGGGTGAYNYPTQGTDGLGGGGGGSRSGSPTLGNAVSGAVGGSGVVIVKYPHPAP